MTSAARATAALDVDRALRLAALVEEDGGSKVADAVLVAAVRAAPPEAAPGLLARMGSSVPETALDAAERAAPGPLRAELLAAAEAALATEAAEQRIPLLGRLAAVTEGADRTRATAALAAAVAEADATAPEERPWNWIGGRVRAAESLRHAEPDLADTLLEAVSAVPATTSTDYGLRQVVRAWAALHRMEHVREVTDRLLAQYRGLGWYGPAGDIAALAVSVDAVDQRWARDLADEAVGLVTDGVGPVDEFERSRLDSKRGSVVQEFEKWDVTLALRVARQMAGSWIPGGPWRSTDGRLSALASIGLTLADRDLPQSVALLEECLAAAATPHRFGAADARLGRGGIYRPADGTRSGDSSIRAANFVAYLGNLVNYWLGGRDWRHFAVPADVLRSVMASPAERAAQLSWAGAVVAAVGSVAGRDVNAALALAGRILNPHHHVVAAAYVTAHLVAAGDPRGEAAVLGLRRCATRLPVYEPELDLTVVPQQPVLVYLDPGVRTRFEAALVLAPAEHDTAAEFVAQIPSGYVQWTYHAELYWTWLFSAQPEQVTDAERASLLDVIGRLPDPLQQDLLRAAGSAVVAVTAPADAAALADEISTPWIAALGRVLRLGPSDPPEASLDLLGDLGAISPLHRAALAAWAANTAQDATVAARCVDRGVAAVEEADPLQALGGLMMLARVAEPERAGIILRRCVALVTEVGNRYVRDPLLTDMLAAALATGDGGVVAQVVRVLVDAGWTALMDGFTAAMPILVHHGGPGVVDTLDQALRAAQAVVDLDGSRVDADGHLDGVAGPDTPADLSWLDGPPPEPGYPELFLDDTDLPLMHVVQDSRLGLADPDDADFDRLDGRRSGMRIWMGQDTDPEWRLVDIRWVFPDAERAAEYHRTRMTANSEGNPPVPDAPPVGEECAVFGGRRPTGVGPSMTMYFYVFRVGRAVVKLFVAQGMEAPEDALTVARVFDLARLAERRCRQLKAS